MKYNILNILQKLNQSEKEKNSHYEKTHQDITLAGIMRFSFAEVTELASDALTWGEKKYLHEYAKSELKENKMAESRILSRANPQLANAVNLGIYQSLQLRSYNDLFGERASKYVKPGDVSSMFSPAGYLTELYREARSLHPADSAYHLDNRRPDLATLSLSQSNMDDELSTLSLSNELLMNNIQAKENIDYNAVLEMLSTYRQTGVTPFDMPFQSIRQSIILQDKSLSAFRRNPDVAKQMDAVSLSGIKSDISAELYAILTQEITEQNADALIKENFGGDVDINTLQDITCLAHYYGLQNDEMESLFQLLIAEEINPKLQHYHNDLMSMLLVDEDSLKVVLIKRSPVTNAYQLNYAELIPKGGDNYLFNFSLTDNYTSYHNVHIGTGDKPESGDLFQDKNFSYKPNSPISIPVQLTAPIPADGLTIGITRYSSSGGYSFNSTKFTLQQYSYSLFILKLNKFIRLYKVTDLSLSDIFTIIESNNNDLTITGDVLTKLFRMNEYRQRYSIDTSDAIVLAGASINQQSHRHQPSAFTRWFNLPLLNNQEFSVDGISIKLDPDSITDTFRVAVLKRAFQVNDSELYTLWSLAQGTNSPPDFICSIDNLSALCRVSLLAQVHGLKVTELAALLSVSPYTSFNFVNPDAGTLSEVVNFLDLHTQWLKEQDCSASKLYLMTTDRYSTTLSPDIDNLLTTLKNGLANINIAQGDDATLIASAAPLTAAATGLDSAETAVAVLQWLNQLKPQGLAIKDFLTQAGKENRTPDETQKLVGFCQVLGQMVLIVRTFKLTAGELSLAVTQPQKFLPVKGTLPRDITTVRNLARFHRWLQRCGGAATEMLSSLGDGTLTTTKLAQAMGFDVRVVAQGLAQSNKDASVFASWSTIDITLQWLDVANSFHITPETVAQLASLNNAKPEDPSDYGTWNAVSHALIAGLNKQQTAQLNAALDEALSSALCAWFIRHLPPANSKATNTAVLGGISSRDELYSYLLIDNQVSAQVTTTRLEEAITSIQLYVNRTLSGQESGVDYAVRSHPFFINWDSYNKRYSTWAGVSQLVYYPENYVDPTIRIGQTSMMDEMLQLLGQSQLTSDSVEDAFKTYMTRFEDIANLDVVSGYHDSLSDKGGFSWLIGRSNINDYYWRSADISKMVEGKLPANSWSEWKKITAAISAINNQVRPVIFQSRLYIVWIESKVVSSTDGDKTTKSTEYTLNYAHILHDGTWSSPQSILLG